MQARKISEVFSDYNTSVLFASEGQQQTNKQATH